MKRKQVKPYKHPELIKLAEKYRNSKDFNDGLKIIFANIEAGVIPKEKYVEDGDQVKLNIEKIMSAPDWDKLNPNFKDFCLNHSEDVFTVEYIPKFGDRPSIVRLREDDSSPNWYFYTGDLTILK